MSVRLLFLKFPVAGVSVPGSAQKGSMHCLLLRSHSNGFKFTGQHAATKFFVPRERELFMEGRA